MPSHYIYRVDHDLGFAPRATRDLCTLCGCKTSTVERWAKLGSWIVGIGGNGTGMANRLIYAMQVASTPTYDEFRQTHPRDSAYLRPYGPKTDAPVLVANHFYYFGNNAQQIPPQLAHIIHPTQGCKRLSDQDITLLKGLVLSHFVPGLHGEPNNQTTGASCGTC